MDSLRSATHYFRRALRGRLAYIGAIRAVQLGLFLTSGISAFLLRFEFSLPPQFKDALWLSVWVWLLLKILVFHSLGLGRGMWRYFATPDLVRVAMANLASSALASFVILRICVQPFPRSVLIIDFVLSLLLTTAARAVTRLFLELASRSRDGSQSRAFIYGGGAAGSMLLGEVRSSPSFPHVICGFIDDDPDKRGMLINGMPVRGNGADLRRLVAEHGIREVLIATPSATGTEMSHMIEHCHRAGVVFRTVPAISEIVASRGVAAQIRNVAVEDVLGRSPVELDQQRIRERLHGRVALVSGAAGSIGSELCRQIARFEPAALVAFDVSETALFHLEREIRRDFPKLEFEAQIGSIQNRQRLCDVFRQSAPSLVYHAAAYKHVPLMETHAFEAVENNVLGTYNLATVASEFGADDFVMISSDKAVRPTNIMGATKRVAELLIRSMQDGGPRYVSVRFGNVLGSNGSVVPIFQKQIAGGGPVTVTHPAMQRYFMTIPEAAQLVLQASTMGSGGEIFVLDMGKPVRIVDLARQLILLSGLKPDEDIRIEFTGLRPGEKLFEELSLAGEQIVATGHEKIKAFAGMCMPYEEAIHHLSALRHACEARDLRGLMFALKDMVPDYNPSKPLLQSIIEPGLARLSAAISTSDTSLPRREPPRAWTPDLLRTQ